MIEHDDEIWQTFLAEGEDILSSAEEILNQLQIDPSHKENIDSLFRGIHTFKGICGMMGFSHVESFAHKAEDLIGAIRNQNQTLDETSIKILFSVVDQLNHHFNYVKLNQTDIVSADHSELEKQLNQLTESKKEIPQSAQEEESQFFVHQPSLDPAYIKIFFEIVDEKLPLLHDAIEKLYEDFETERSNAMEAVEQLVHAAHTMGYQCVFDILTQLSQQLQQLKEEDKIDPIVISIINLYSEMDVIYKGFTDLEIIEQNLEPHLVFNQTYLTQLEIKTQQFYMLAKKLNEKFTHDALGAFNEAYQLLGEIRAMLKFFYKVFIYHRLQNVAYTVLALDDLCERMSIYELEPSSLWAQCCYDLAIFFTNLLKQLDVEDISQYDLEKIIEKCREIFRLQSLSPAAKAAALVIDSMDIPEKIRKHLTQKNLEDIAKALEKNIYFYVIEVDLETNYAFSEKFSQLFKLSSIEFVSNSAEHQKDKLISYFLIMSEKDESFLRELLLNIDPKNKHHTLQLCHFVEHVTLDKQLNAIEEEIPEKIEEQKQSKQNILVQHLAEIEENMLQTQISLQSAQYKIENLDIVGKLKKLQLVSKTKLKNATYALENMYIHNTEELLKEINFANEKFSKLVELFYDLNNQITGVTVQQNIQPLLAFAKEYATSLHKNVHIELKGGELLIEQDFFIKLIPILKEILSFCIEQSIETEQVRKEKKLPAQATLEIVFQKTDNQVSITVKDDGLGFEVLKQKSFFDPLRLKIHELRGTLKRGKNHPRGSKFVIAVSLGQIVMDSMIVRVKQFSYLIPMKSVKRIIRVEQENITGYASKTYSPTINFEDKFIPLVQLSDNRLALEKGLIVIIETNKEMFGFPVDELLGLQQILLHPLKGYLAEIPYLRGCALLSNGEIGMVIDADRLGMNNNFTPFNEV